MSDDLELVIECCVKDGERHTLIEWLPCDLDAAELAISLACRHAAIGKRFRGIQTDEKGSQRLWLIG